MSLGRIIKDLFASIPTPTNASSNSLREFQSKMFRGENSPSYTSLYSVRFSSSPLFMRSGQYRLERDANAFLLDYMAQSINLPSKQVTTAAVVNQGSAIKYPTGVAFSQINMTFQMPRSQRTRSIFERWIQLISNDADQYVDFYEDYCCPVVRIYKLERGGGDLAAFDFVYGRGVRDSGYDPMRVRQNDVTACWELRNLYPMNIGSVQLNGMDSRLMTLTVGFNFERYRFYPKGQFDWRGVLPNPDINPDAVANRSTYSYPSQPRGDESWVDNFK